MQETLRLVSEVVNSALWQQATLANKPAICSVSHGTHGIFTALDFHTTHCCTKLIEINTNAGGGWLNLGIAAQMLAATDPDAHKFEQTAQLLEEPFVSMFLGPLWSVLDDPLIAKF